jgi:hypothetical protein
MQLIGFYSYMLDLAIAGLIKGRNSGAAPPAPSSSRFVFGGIMKIGCNYLSIQNVVMRTGCRGEGLESRVYTSVAAGHADFMGLFKKNTRPWFSKIYAERSYGQVDKRQPIRRLQHISDIEDLAEGN